MNSIAKRLTALLAFADEHCVDVALLQETKSTAEKFPRAEIEAAGWQVALVAEKGFNGVAVLSRDPALLVRRRELPTLSQDQEKDEQARYLEVETHGIIVASIYAPNGNPVYSPDDELDASSTTSKKFRYKLAWMDRLCSYIENQLLIEGCHFLLGGDFNVCSQASDVFDEQAMAGDALLRTESRNRYRRMICSGLVDAWREVPLVKKAQNDNTERVQDNGYTYWDYRGGRFQRDEGLRIDMFFLSPYLSERMEDCFVASELRALDNPSDHAPLCLDLTCDERVSSKAPKIKAPNIQAPNIQAPNMQTPNTHAPNINPSGLDEATKTKQQSKKETVPSKSQLETSAQKTLEM